MNFNELLKMRTRKSSADYNTNISIGCVGAGDNTFTIGINVV